MILFSISGFAQDVSEYGTPEERAERMTSEMEKELPLEANQVDEIKALNLKYARIIQEEVIETELSLFGKYKKVKSINSEKEKKMMELWSKNYYKNYETLTSKHSIAMLLKFF